MPQPGSHPSEYTDVRGAAAHLNLSPAFLNKLRVVGTGPKFYKFGRLVRYRIGDLDCWSQTRARMNTSEYIARSERAA